MRRRTAWLWLMALEMVFYIVLAVLCSVTPRQFKTESGACLKMLPAPAAPADTPAHQCMLLPALQQDACDVRGVLCIMQVNHRGAAAS